MEPYTLTDAEMANLRHLYAQPNLDRGLADGLLAPVIRAVESRRAAEVERTTQLCHYCPHIIVGGRHDAMMDHYLTAHAEEMAREFGPKRTNQGDAP